MLSSTQLFAELPDLRRYVRRSSHSLPSLTREVQTTEDASPKCAYLLLRNMRRPNVKSPDYLPNLLRTKTAMETQTATGLGKKGSWGIFFQVILVEKRLMFHSRCLGCVGYVYVGRIYQNRGETLLR